MEFKGYFDEFTNDVNLQYRMESSLLYFMKGYLESCRDFPFVGEDRETVIDFINVFFKIVDIQVNTLCDRYGKLL